MPTRDDVAKQARVSSATVSRVFNAEGNVSKEKRVRVLTAAEALGYVPDKNASALRRSGSGAIGFLETRKPGLSADRHYAWLYAEIIRAVKTVVDASPYRLVLLSADTPSDIRALASRGLCDALICHDMSDPSMVGAIQKTGLPNVVCWRYKQSGVSTVGLNEVMGGRMVAERFTAAGLSKPAHITSMLKTHPACMERYRGFTSVFPKTSVKTLDGKFGIQGGYDSAKKILSDIRAHKIDCLFVVNDLTAVGAIQALLEAGLKIPDDISVVGYGNLPFIDTLPVSLTTIDEQMGALYARAAETVLGLLREKRIVHALVNPLFIERNTVKRRLS